MGLSQKEEEEEKKSPKPWDCGRAVKKLVNHTHISSCSNREEGKVGKLLIKQDCRGSTHKGKKKKNGRG